MAGLKLFYSYAHVDEPFRIELEKWLTTLRQEGLIKEWHDRKLTAGEQIIPEIDKNLKKADVVLLLLSQDFLASSSCIIEMNYALENLGTKRTVPIILKLSTWLDTECRKLLALPKDGKPIATWDSQEKAWLDVFNGLKRLIMQLLETIDLRKSFIEQVERTEFVKQNRQKVFLRDIFVYPCITRDRDIVSANLVTEKILLHDKDRAILIRGRESSGKSALLRWLYFSMQGDYAPIILDGDTIFKTLNFEEIVRKEFSEQYSGNYEIWRPKHNKIALIDNFHHKISRNILDYLRDTFDRTIIAVDDEEYLVYFKEDPACAEFTVLSLRQLSLSKQEELIRKWKAAADEGAPTEEEDLSVEKIEETIDNIIVNNQILPRYPFYVLSIMQSLEAFMPRDLSITAYGDCYQALVTAQLIKKRVKLDEIDTCFNYLTELAYDMYQTSLKGGAYELGNYANFKENYRLRFFIQPTIISRIERDDYPLIVLNDDRVVFQYPYIYYFFLGRYLASNIDKGIIDGLCQNLHIKSNSYIIIFTIHHTQNRELLTSILLHCKCTFEGISPAVLDAKETRSMNDLIAQLPKDIISKKPVKEIRQEEREDLDKIRVQMEKENEENPGAIEIGRGLRIIEVLGQILKNRAGSFTKQGVLEMLEEAIDLGLRIIRIFLIDFKKPEIVIWLSKNLEEAQKDLTSRSKRELDQDQKLKYAEQTVKVLGYFITIGMLSKIAHSIRSDKLTEAVGYLAAKRKTTAFELLEFILELSQEGINVDRFKALLQDFATQKNIWAASTLSMYVQSYMNSHNIEQRKRQAIFSLLGLKYFTNR